MLKLSTESSLVDIQNRLTRLETASRARASSRSTESTESDKFSYTASAKKRIQQLEHELAHLRRKSLQAEQIHKLSRRINDLEAASDEVMKRLGNGLQSKTRRLNEKFKQMQDRESKLSAQVDELRERSAAAEKRIDSLKAALVRTLNMVGRIQLAAPEQQQKQRKHIRMPSHSVETPANRNAVASGYHTMVPQQYSDYVTQLDEHSFVSALLSKPRSP
ncbi:MAG: hypothetical protein MHM6MM_008273 [Cercozoa sp. M6MM]